MNRKQRKLVAGSTLAILQDGAYESPSGRTVDIRRDLEDAQLGTRTYGPNQRIAAAPEPAGTPEQVEVTLESTLAAGRRLHGAGLDVAALNFASAKNPGGGFATGAQAQEESLARASGLVACIADSELYRVNRDRRDPLYTDHAIYSPRVPVFRDDDGTLLDAPWPCSFITCPAPNAGAVLSRAPERRDAVTDALRRRAARILDVAALHGHSALVLGAWGCGVFRNDPEEVARIFAEALRQPRPGMPAHVTFAIYDREDGPTFLAFREFLEEC